MVPGSLLLLCVGLVHVFIILNTSTHPGKLFEEIVALVGFILVLLGVILWSMCLLYTCCSVLKRFPGLGKGCGQPTVPRSLFVFADSQGRGKQESLQDSLIWEENKIESVWDNAHRNPATENFVRLYRCNWSKYVSSEMAHPQLLYLYVAVLWRLALISKVCSKLGFGEIDWWPIASREEIMMVTPFMMKRYFHYVLSSNIFLIF
jgi:hypothetical protein